MVFSFRLEDEAGNAADPPTFRTAVPAWRVGDVIPLPHRSLRVVRCATTTQTRRRRWSLKTCPARPLANESSS
jgi:hypothetical protein